jgi:hypothetical protein
MEVAMTLYRKTAVAAALAGLLALAGPAFASEDNDWIGWGSGMMHGWGMGRGMGPGMMMGMGAEEMLDRIDGRLAFLKTELKITDAQAPAWSELASVVKTTAETHNAMMRKMMEDMRSGEMWKKPLPDRLTLQETHLAARLEQIRSVKGAVDKLYAVLADDQRKVADDIVLPMMGMGMGRGMVRGTMMGPGMMMQ